MVPNCWKAILFALVLVGISDGLQAQEPLRIALFTPRQMEDPFWGRFIGFALKAGSDLGVKVVPHYADGSLPRMRMQIEEAAASRNFQALVFPNFKMGGRAFLESAERHRVPAFIVNSGFTEGELVGVPREQFRYWIGELLPDEEDAGATLAESLIQAGLARLQPGAQLEMFALTGIVSDYASIERTRGLARTVARYPEVQLHQVVPANWKAEDAARSFRILHNRFPEVQVVWCASDVMARGVVEEALRLGLQPGKDLLVGGFDWAETGLQGVRSGVQWSSVGGHFLEGGWSVVMVFDYFRQEDFASLGTRWRSRMGMVTHPTWASLAPSLEHLNPEVLDFREESRSLNPRHVYDLQVAQVLQRVRNEF